MVNVTIEYLPVPGMQRNIQGTLSVCWVGMSCAPQQEEKPHPRVHQGTHPIQILFQHKDTHALALADPRVRLEPSHFHADTINFGVSPSVPIAFTSKGVQDGRGVCSWQGGWNQMIFKVPSNPYHAMILHVWGLSPCLKAQMLCSNSATRCAQHETFLLPGSQKQ